MIKNSYNSFNIPRNKTNPEIKILSLATCNKWGVSEERERERLTCEHWIHIPCRWFSQKRKRKKHCLVGQPQNSYFPCKPFAANTELVSWKPLMRDTPQFNFLSIFETGLLKCAFYLCNDGWLRYRFPTWFSFFDLFITCNVSRNY